MSILEVFVVILFFLLLWGYILFPQGMRLLGKVLKISIARDMSYQPTVSVFVPAYNEEKVIASKIENLLMQNYPQEKLEFLICSDCSSDTTGQIVRSYAEKYSQITFHDYRERSGKTGMINKAIPDARGEIIVFTDANTKFESNAIARIVTGFATPDIGAVLGEVRLFLPQENTGLEGEVAYREFEALIKHVEGLCGSSMGAFGGLYALRKDVFRPLPPHAYSNDDFLLPTRLLVEGKKVVYDITAISHEETGVTVGEEFGRRVRIGAGNFQACRFVLPLLNPFRGVTWIFYFSHKIIRWFSPFLLGLLLILSIFVSPQSPWIAALAIGQILFYLGATVGWFFYSRGFRLPIVQSMYHFTSMNVALFLGFLRFCKGIKSATWTRIDRSVIS